MKLKKGDQIKTKHKMELDLSGDGGVTGEVTLRAGLIGTYKGRSLIYDLCIVEFNLPGKNLSINFTKSFYRKDIKKFMGN